MGLLTDKYGLTEQQERALLRDGIVHFAPVNYYEIWKHFEEVSELYESKAEAVQDCCMHFKLERRSIYAALKKHSEKDANIM